MESSIHVGVGEGHQVLVLMAGWMIMMVAS